jgi:ATP-dependent exoDNAse (exonuclease V) alpha subunit
VASTPRHDRITVEAINQAQAQQAAIEIIPWTMSKLSVYHLNESELSVGDQVRITRNDAQHDLVNGQLAQIVGIEADTVTLETGNRQIILPTDQPLHLDYAYTTTAHRAQGLTCDRVLYNAESFSRTTAQDTYYVSISRERHEVVVFTDDADKLPERVDRLGVKGLAHDLAPAQVESPTLHPQEPDAALEKESEPSMEIS